MKRFVSSFCVIGIDLITSGFPLRLSRQIELKDNSTTTSRAIPTVKICRRSTITCLWLANDPDRSPKHIDVFHDQLKIFCFHIQCLLMFSFHDVMDAEVSCVTLTDNLTSWDIPPGTMEYACASVVVYDKKNNGTLVHVHRVLVACSQKNRDFLFLVTQRLKKKKTSVFKNCPPFGSVTISGNS